MKSRRDEYSSEYEADSEVETKRKKRKYMFSKQPETREPKPKRTQFVTEATGEEAKVRRFHFLSLNAYDRHKELVNNYLLYYGGKWDDFKEPSSSSKPLTDLDVIRKNQKFLWSSTDAQDMSWEQKLAKKYWDKLYKEYCICDLSCYKQNKIAMRWRTEQEVISGKGQFVCGSKRCTKAEGLRSWEVNFGYVEHGAKKNALVKLRLCPECSTKLNYSHRKKEILPPVSKNKAGRSGTGATETIDLTADSSPTSRTKSTPDSSAKTTSERIPGETSSDTAPEKTLEQEIWSGPAVNLTEDKSITDEFDDYLAEMLL